MNTIEPINQTKLFGLNKFMIELIELYNKGNLPSKILLSGQKGLGKATLAYHFINYVLSYDEQYNYDLNNFEINSENQSFKTISNKSNPNLVIVDINSEKKFIEINQIRLLSEYLSKSSFNKKPRFVLIDNIEFLNLNSINALLKLIEEPPSNIYFILINNNKKISSTLLSRCINFKVSLSNKENLFISNKLLNKDLHEIINKDLINYYLTAGKIYHLAKFGEINGYDLSDLNLKQFLKIIIQNNYYKKDSFIKSLIYDLIDFYFIKFNFSIPAEVNNKYSFFLKKISDTKKYNLDEESLFMEFEESILDG